MYFPGEDNPFSFKKFASKQSQRVSGSPPPPPPPLRHMTLRVNLQSCLPSSQRRAEGSSSDSEGGEGHAYNPLSKKMPELTASELSPKSQHSFGITRRGVRSDSESSTERSHGDPLGPMPLVTANVLPPPPPPPPPLVVAADTTTTAIADDESSDDDDPEDGPVAPPPILRLASEPPAELLMELSKVGVY